MQPISITQRWLALLLLLLFGLPTLASPAHLDEPLSPLWVRQYDASASSYGQARDVAVDGSGNVIVTGGSNGGCATVSYAEDGTERWARRIAQAEGAGGTLSLDLRPWLRAGGRNTVRISASGAGDGAALVTIGEGPAPTSELGLPTAAGTGLVNREFAP